MVMGLNAKIEGEEGEGGDRTFIGLFPHQETLLQQVSALGKPVVLVIAAGSAIAVNWAQEHIPAILDVWYPGQRGGDATADVIFGDYNPAGRLPLTFYKSDSDLPDFRNYDMAGRTYRYFKGEPLYPFGFGLSYTTFEYGKPVAKATPDGGFEVAVSITNTGKRAGDEVAQLYLSRKNTAPDSGLPIKSLRGFKRLHLQPGESKSVVFHLTPFQLAFADRSGNRSVTAGDHLLEISGGQPPARQLTLQITKPATQPAYAFREPTILPSNP
jgi:beta-glucosidase